LWVEGKQWVYRRGEFGAIFDTSGRDGASYQRGVYWFGHGGGLGALLELAAEAGKCLRAAPKGLSSLLNIGRLDPWSEPDDARFWLLSLFGARTLAWNWRDLKSRLWLVPGGSHAPVEVPSAPEKRMALTSSLARPLSHLAEAMKSGKYEDFYCVLGPDGFSASAAACELLGGYSGVFEAMDSKGAADSSQGPASTRLYLSLLNTPHRCEQLAKFSAHVEEMRRSPRLIRQVAVASVEEGVTITEMLREEESEERCPMGWLLGTWAQAERLEREVTRAQECLALAAREKINEYFTPGSMNWTVRLGVHLDRVIEAVRGYRPTIREPRVLLSPAIQTLTEVAPLIAEQRDQLKALNDQLSLAEIKLPADKREAKAPHKRGWVQAELDDAIRDYKAKRSARYAALKDGVRRGLKGARKAARELFGARAIARELGVRSHAMVSGSPAWLPIAADLQLGKTRVGKPKRVGLDVALEAAAEELPDAALTMDDFDRAAEGVEIAEDTLAMLRSKALSGEYSLDGAIDALTAFPLKGRQKGKRSFS
jgi:hypothetical protein